MTHNEAMSVLINSDRIWDGITRKEKEAINMAIVALEDCADPKWIPPEPYKEVMPNDKP